MVHPSVSLQSNPILIPKLYNVNTQTNYYNPKVRKFFMNRSPRRGTAGFSYKKITKFSFFWNETVFLFVYIVYTVKAAGNRASEGVKKL